jgi:cytochrome c biogenesis protein CcmG/thiol:disulfide interchange protein DsbE
MRTARTILVTAALAVALASCGSSDKSGAPPARAVGADKLGSEGGKLLGGGLAAFNAQLAQLKGTPVVVNQWASWCGPCRFEFPFFISVAKQLKGQVAFVGVDSNDNRGDAERFLREFPTPYPHFEDGDVRIARSFRGGRAFPTTVIYDKRGKLVYTHPGAYASEDKFKQDIERYTGVATR